MNLELECKGISIEPISGRVVAIVVTDAEDGQILDHFKLKDIISHFGEDEFLDFLGPQKAKDYFDLIDNPE